METSNIITIIIIVLLFFAFISAGINEPKQKFPKYDPPKPPLNPDKTFLKAVDDCVKEIESERFKKRVMQQVRDINNQLLEQGLSFEQIEAFWIECITIARQK
jgi:hypothetical protein